MKRFDIAPFGLPNGPAGEVKFEEPRDVDVVEVVFAGVAPRRAKLHYMRKFWPGQRVERVMGHETELSGVAVRSLGNVWGCFAENVKPGRWVGRDTATWKNKKHGRFMFGLDRWAAETRHNDPWPVIKRPIRTVTINGRVSQAFDATRGDVELPTVGGKTCVSVEYL